MGNKTPITPQSFKHQGHFLDPKFTAGKCLVIKADIDGDGDKDKVGLCITGTSGFEHVQDEEMPFSANGSLSKFQQWKKKYKVIGVPGKGLFVDPSKIDFKKNAMVALSDKTLGPHQMKEYESLWSRNSTARLLYSTADSFLGSVRYIYKWGTKADQSRLQGALLSFIKKPTITKAKKIISFLNGINQIRKKYQADQTRFEESSWKYSEKASSAKSDQEKKTYEKKAKEALVLADKAELKVSGSVSVINDAKVIQFLAKFATTHTKDLRKYAEKAGKVSELESLVKDLPKKGDHRAWKAFQAKLLF